MKKRKFLMFEVYIRETGYRKTFSVNSLDDKESIVESMRSMNPGQFVRVRNLYPPKKAIQALNEIREILGGIAYKDFTPEDLKALDEVAFQLMDFARDAQKVLKGG